MSKTLALWFALIASACFFLACGHNPRYKKSVGGAESDSAETPAADTAEVRGDESKTIPAHSPAGDSCVWTAHVNYRQGFTYYKGEMFTGEACSYYEGGALHTLTHYENGRRSGDWTVYYPDGVIEKSGTVRSGVEDGLYIENHPNGNRRYEYHYDMGTRTGKWRSWYEDGTPYTERNFSNGLLHGKVLVWDENGELAKEYDYVHGQLMNSVMHFEGG